MFRRPARVLQVALLFLAVLPATAHAYEVRVTILGAGTITETTPANLVGAGCTTAANTPTGTVGKTCLAGTPSGDYGWNWDVDYVATPKSGYSFVRWESDGTSRPAVICDRSTPAATTSTYTGATCKFRTPSDLQTRAVFVDATDPEMSSLNGPSQPVNGPTTFTFSATADPTVVGFECRVANVHDWLGCSSGRAENPASSGAYTFEVRAIDASGNRSSVWTWPWTVDKTPPETTLAGGGPSGLTNSRTAQFAFSKDEAGTFECVLSRAPSTSVTDPACGSGKTYENLVDGSYTFRVAARDSAGNLDPTPATRTFSVDGTPPDTVLSGGPSGTTTATTASFTLSSPDGGATFICQINGGATTSCSSPYDLTGLAPGTYTLQVWARDAASNQDPTPATRTWTVVAPAEDPGAGSGGGGGGSTTTSGGVTTASTGTTGTSGTASAPGSAPPLVIGSASGTARIDRRGAFSVPGQIVRCPAGCTVRVRVAASVPARALASVRRRLVLANMAVRPDSAGKLKVKLTRKGLRTLKKLKRIRTTVTIRVTPAGGGAPVVKSVKVTLRAR